MEALSSMEVGQVSGGTRTLQAVGDFLGFAAGASLLLGPEAVPLAISLGIASAAFELTDSFLE